MKLSELEKLVATMRAHAIESHIEDPNVEFYDSNRECLLAALDNPFVNMEPLATAAEEIRSHVVPQDGTSAKRGDFAIPLCVC